MGVALGVLQEVLELLFDFGGDHMLHGLGIVVHMVGRKVQIALQVELPQAVESHHALRLTQPFVAEPIGMQVVNQQLAALQAAQATAECRGRKGTLVQEVFFEYGLLQVARFLAELVKEFEDVLAQHGIAVSPVGLPAGQHAAPV